MVGQRSRRDLWLNRLVALASFFLAIFCLYLALSQLGERLLTDHLVNKLNAKGVESSWTRIEWSGRGICAHLARIRVPKERFTAEVNQVCARISLKRQWPFIGIDDLLIDQPKMWINVKSPRREQISSHGHRSVEEREFGYYLSTFDRALALGAKTWRSLTGHLATLGEQKIEIREGELQLLLRPTHASGRPSHLLFGVELNLSSTGGSGRVRLAEQAQVVHVEFIPQEISLRSPLRFEGAGLKLTVEPGARLLYRRGSFKFESFIRLQRFERSVNNDDLRARIELSHQESERGSTLEVSLLNTATDISSSHRSRGLQGLFSELCLNALYQGREVEKLQVIFKGLEFAELSDLFAGLSLWDSLGSASRLNVSKRGKLSPPTALRGSLTGELSLNESLSPQQGKLGYKLRISRPKLRMLGLPKLGWPAISVSGDLDYQWGGSSQRQTLSRIEIKDAQIRVETPQSGQVRASLTTSLVTDQPVSGWTFPLKAIQSLDFALESKRTECQALFNLIPKSVLGPITSAQLSGSTEPQVRFKYRRAVSGEKNKEPASLQIKGLLRRCRFEEMGLNLSPRPRVKVRGRRASLRDVTWLNEAFTFKVNPELAEGKRVIIGPASDNFVAYNELPAYIGGAMYLTEETGFWRGGAFSPALLNRAINTNLTKGRFVYGGSTITQQLVKNLFLHREKTLTRKIREALISARVIDAISKRRVLELYLNMIEFGPKIFGIQAAAKFYFQKEARALSPEEAVFLAMLKVAPHRGPKWVKRGVSPTFTWWRQRMIQVFKRLVSEGLITPKRALGAAPFVLRWSEGQYQGSAPMGDEEK